MTVGFTISCENKAVGNQLGLGPRIYVNGVISNMISYFIQSRSEKAVKFSEIKACNSSDSRKLNFQKNIAPSSLSPYQQQLCTFSPNSDISGHLQFSYRNWTEVTKPLDLCSSLNEVKSWRNWTESWLMSRIFFRELTRSMNLSLLVGNFWAGMSQRSQSRTSHCATSLLLLLQFVPGCEGFWEH